MVLQGWLLPRLGRQGALSKLVSLTSLPLSPPFLHHDGDNEDREEGTQHNGGTVLTVV